MSKEWTSGDPNKMSNSASSWSQWVSDFKKGRTHVAYALIAGSISSGYLLLFLSSLQFRLAALITFLACLGALVDTVAHLYYH